MIPIHDLRKGNLIKTEYGILPVHALIFNEVQVKGKDGRILWAKEIEGVGINSDLFDRSNLLNFARKIENIGIVCNWQIAFVHEAQNLHYWLFREELELNLDKNMSAFDILIDSMKRAGQSHTKMIKNIKKTFGIE